MPLESLPIWGQWGLLGVLLGVVVFVIYAIINGKLVTRSQVEQVQQMADTYLRAFEVAQSTTEQQGRLLESLTTTSESMQKLLDSLPQEDTRT